MMRLLSLLVLVLATAVPAQSVKVQIEAMAPIVSQSWDDDAIFNVHADGAVSLLSAEGGELVASFYQGPIGGADTPKLETTWCDALGVTHKVSTPIDSSSEAGVDRAMKLHEKLVARMQQLHPPQPCNPPS